MSDSNSDSDTRILTRQENEKYLKILKSDIPARFVNGRLFHYEYINERHLNREANALYGIFYNQCIRLIRDLYKFANNLPVGVTRRHENEFNVIAFRHLPNYWPDRQDVWMVAITMCHHHLFKVDSGGVRVSYLIYGCDPVEFREHYDNYKHMDEYQWNALFAHANTPLGQLGMLAGIDMAVQANEYNSQLPRLQVLSVFLEQMNRSRTNRLLPANSITDWTQYAPSKEWQLQQALARAYISYEVIRMCWTSIKFYTGTMYTEINGFLRNAPLTMRYLRETFGPGSAIDTVAIHAWRIQWLMALSPVLPSPAIVYRYHSGNLWEAFGSILGEPNKVDDDVIIARLRNTFISMYGFTSTTINLNYVLSKLIANTPHHLLEIQLPPGTHCCSWPSQEYELILPHRSTLQFVTSYVIGTYSLSPNDATLVNNLTPQQQENVRHIRVLVFRLVFDGIDFDEMDHEIPDEVRKSVMPMPITLRDSLPKRHKSYNGPFDNTTINNQNNRRRPSSRRRSASGRLLHSNTLTYNYSKKRTRPSSSYSTPHSSSSEYESPTLKKQYREDAK